MVDLYYGCSILYTRFPFIQGCSTEKQGVNVGDYLECIPISVVCCFGGGGLPCFFQVLMNFNINGFLSCLTRLQI